LQNSFAPDELRRLKAAIEAAHSPDDLLDVASGY